MNREQIEARLIEKGLPYYKDSLREVEAIVREAVEAARVDERSQSEAASKAIDAWVTVHERKIPWDKCVKIIAIVTRMSDDERDRLLALGDEK